jgi:ubiquinone/menaquinone biosynthesis C-methylase UbiE/protein-S-isoprenylcysteine O-methyltransferase Ste14
MTIWGVGPRLLIPSWLIAAGCLWLTFRHETVLAIPLLPRAVELIAGFIITGLGTLLLVLSGVSISKGFPEDRLVQGGVYGLVRHPIYSAHIVFLMPGLAFLLDAWLLGVVAAVTTLAFTRMIRREESFLEEKFGEQYLEYRSSVPALVPYRMPRARVHDSKQLSQERYGRYGEGYVDSAAHARGEELARLVEIADPRPDWQVLDVATGAGHTALRFAPFVASVTATDITPKMVETARSFLSEKEATNVSCRRADAEDLPFEDGSFDLVTCRIAPHHFPDCARFVRESTRVLRAGGLLLVQDHVLPEDEAAARRVDDFERLRDPSHHRAYTEVEWRAMFRSAGLVVEHAEQIAKRHQLRPWAERQGCSEEIIEQLIGMVEGGSPAFREWIAPRDFGTPEASFVNRHLIIAGRKG